MNKVNTITLTKRDFGTEEELYKALADQLKLLLKSGNQCVVSDVDPKGGKIQISYSDASREPKPYWLLDLEAAEAQNLHDQIEFEMARLFVESREEQYDDYDDGEEDEEPEESSTIKIKNKGDA